MRRYLFFTLDVQNNIENYHKRREPRTHQIHIYQSGSRYLIEQLTFRGYLI